MLSYGVGEGVAVLREVVNVVSSEEGRGGEANGCECAAERGADYVWARTQTGERNKARAQHEARDVIYCHPLPPPSVRRSTESSLIRSTLSAPGG